MESTRDEVSVSEAARRFGVSARTVTNMINSGVIKARRPTGAKRGMFRIPEAEIERHLADSEVRHQIETGQLVPAEATAA